MSLPVNSLRSGGKFMLDGVPSTVIENEHVKPGKGQAFNRIKARNMISGRVATKTFPSNAMVGEADIHEANMRLLYSDHEGWHFMDESSYEQLVLSDKEMMGVKCWMVDGALATVVIWQGRAISVIPPTFVELAIIECAPNAKGDTVSGGSKTSLLETQHEIKVPLFVEQGDKIKIDTRTGEYVSRV